jgi:hypothetical protein
MHCMGGKGEGNRKALPPLKKERGHDRILVEELHRSRVNSVMVEVTA